MEIIYTQADRTETLTSSAALRKILGRFVHHRVFFEMSSRDRAGNVFFSTKNTFIVSAIEVTNRVDLSIMIFDRQNSAHSVEVLNPTTMRVYEENAGKGFAVAFVTDSSKSGVETRCYLRDEGPNEEEKRANSELEKISLPQLFEYLEDLTMTEAVGEITRSLLEFTALPARNAVTE